MGINIGKYRERVIFQSFTTARQANGSITRTYSTLYTRWAEVIPTGGSENTQNDEKVANRQITIRIRKQGVTLNEMNRAVWRGETYDIISIDPFGAGLQVGYEIRAVSKDNS